MRLKFRCGCVHEVNVDRVADPCCPTHRTRVARVLGGVRPSFRGHGSGPLLQPEALEAVPMKLAPQGALPLKTKEDRDGAVR